MLENTEEKAASMGKVVPTNQVQNVRDYINRMNASKQLVKDSQTQQWQTNNFDQSLSLYGHGISTNNQDLKNSYDKAGKIEEAAGMISAFNGTTGNAQDVISNFIEEHDWEDGSMYNAFYDFIQNGSITSDELASRTIDKVAAREEEDRMNSKNAIQQNEYTYKPPFMQDKEEEQTTLSEGIEGPVLSDRWGNIYTKGPYTDDEGTLATNIPGAAMGMVQNIGGLLESRIDRGLNKVGLMSDDAVENAEKLRQVTRAEDYLMGINEEDFSYKAAQFLEELGAWIGMDIATGGSSTGAFEGWLAKKAPGLLKLFKAVYKNKLGKISLDLLKKGGKGGVDMFWLNTMEGEDTSLSDIGWAALFNILTGGMFSKSKADKQTIKGIMNPSAAEEVLKMLKDKGIDISMEDLGEFINRRFKGSREQIAKQAKVWQESAEKLRDALLSMSQKKVKSETTTKVLTAIAENLEKKITSAGEYTVEDNINRVAAARIRAMIREGDVYTLTEIKDALKELTKSALDPFTKKFGETKEGASEEVFNSLRNWYTELKETIEKTAKEEGLGDIKNLNREIYASYELAKGVLKKDIVEELGNKLPMAKTGLGAFIGGIGGYIAGNTSIGALVGAMLSLGRQGWKKLMKSVNVRTNLSDLIYKFAGEEKAGLLDWVSSEGMKKLSESEEKEIQNILKNADKSWWDKFAPTVLKDFKEYISTELGQEVSPD